MSLHGLKKLEIGDIFYRNGLIHFYIALFQINKHINNTPYLKTIKLCGFYPK